MLSITSSNEGGFQADPEDSGSVEVDGVLLGTNRGITPRTLADSRGITVEELTQDDIKDLSQEEADSILRQNFLVEPQIDQLPDGVQQAVFDFGVTAGPTQAIKILQRVAGVTDDGIIGPDTVEAAESVERDDVIDAFIEFYQDLAESSPRNQRFLDGWVDRANRNR